MKYSLTVLLLLATALTPWQVDAHRVEKPRVIVTTDGEIDDRSSMVRFLMYASDLDVAGIVQVNGVQKDGHSKEHWIEEQIAHYKEVLPNLRKHNPDYPDAEELLQVIAVGRYR